MPALLPGGRYARAVSGALVVGLLVLPVTNAVAAGVRFADPVYTTDYEAQVARYAAIVAGPGRISWVGNAFPLHPRDYVFDPADPFTYIYHDYVYQTTFWTRQWVFPLLGYATTTSPAGGLPFVYPGIANVLRDGDVIIVNPSSDGYQTDTMPALVPPLVVMQVHTQAFFPTSTAGRDARLFASATMPGTIRIHQESAAYVVEASGMPDGRYELYSPESTTSLLHSMARLVVAGGRFRVAVPVASWPGQITPQKLIVLYYDSAVSFPSPSEEAR